MSSAVEQLSASVRENSCGDKTCEDRRLTAALRVLRGGKTHIEVAAMLDWPHALVGDHGDTGKTWCLICDLTEERVRELRLLAEVAPSVTMTVEDWNIVGRICEGWLAAHPKNALLT